MNERSTEHCPLAWSHISMHSRSLLWHWRCPWCWKDVVTQRVMFYLDGRKEVGINPGGKLRFQRAISFVLPNLAGTSRSGLQRCLKVAYYIRKWMATFSKRIQFEKKKTTTFSPLFASNQSLWHSQQSNTFCARNLCISERSLPSIALCTNLSHLEAANLFLYLIVWLA